MKKAVRRRDGYRCTKCGMLNAEHVFRYGSQLQVHRVVPRSDYSVIPGVCVTLCIPCHGPEPRMPKSRFRPLEATGRVRVIVHISLAHKRAFLSRSSIEGLSPQEFFQNLIERYCPDDLERARQAIGGSPGDDDGSDDPPKKPRRKNRDAD